LNLGKRIQVVPSDRFVVRKVSQGLEQRPVDDRPESAHTTSMGFCSIDVRHGGDLTTGQIDQATVDIVGDAKRRQGDVEVQVTRRSHLHI